MIAPHRDNRIRPATQGGRNRRQYARCWKIEWLFARPQNFRRRVMRFEYPARYFLG